MQRISKPVIRHFADYIEKETGILYFEENSYQLENRLDEVCRTLNIAHLQDLFRLAEVGLFGQQKQVLLDIATNNETSFFRDSKVFRAFQEFILPEVRKSVETFCPLRIWSVASSFGQEPYSLAMILEELTEKNPDYRRAEILTTDISKRALERVKAGVYSHLEVQRGLSASLLIKYFEKKTDDSWELKDNVKRRVSSQHMNLLQITGVQGPFDVIFCRNVLIYQSEDKKREIVKNLSSYLKPGGFFILGAAESLIGVSDNFSQIEAEGAVFYRKK